MSKVLDYWISKTVTVTLRAPAPVPVRISGKLSDGDTSFVIIDQGEKGQVLIPVTSILHIADKEAEF